MKPFDLEAAKRGEPLITRDGRKVTDFAHFPSKEGAYKVYAVIGGDTSSFTEEGNEWNVDCSQTNLDLFMAPRKRTVYVNLWPGKMIGTGGGCGGYHYDDKETARAAAFNTRGVDAFAVAVPVEIEV